MYKELILKLSSNPSFKNLITKNSAGKSLVSRFVAGETMHQVIEVVHNLNKEGIKATIDCLGEDITTIEEAKTACQNYLDLLDCIYRENVQSNISIKLTKIGLRINPQLCQENLKQIAENAVEKGNFVRIDMESSSFTKPTLDLFYQLYPNYPNLGVVIQAYLYRSREDVQKLIDIKARVRLCKGAYKEPSKIAYSKKSDVDINYKNLIRMLLRDGNCPAIATHDQNMISAAKDFNQAIRRSKNEFEFQMLYGVRSDIQQQLAKDGWGIRVYVPFGKDWYSYLTRRIAERPANLMFVLKNLLQIQSTTLLSVGEWIISVPAKPYSARRYPA